jgi:hypothetical protein
MKTWWNDYISLKYLKKGRDKDGIDCWGLVKLIYKEQYNIDLPSFSDEYEAEQQTKIEQLIALGKEGWEKVDTPTIGDVALLRVNGLFMHVGVVVSPNQFIHVSEHTDTTIERFDTGIWKHRVEGFYRYVEKVNVGDLTLAIKPHPLKTERIDGQVPANSSVADIIEFVKTQYPVAQEYNCNAVIFVNGKLVPQEEWHMVPLPGDVIQYRAVAEGNVLRIIASIAIVVAASYFTAGLVTAGYVSAGVAASAVQAGLTVVGSLLLNAIFPVRMPTQEAPGTALAQNLLQGGSNQASQYGAIPVVLGQMRFTGLLGAQIYAESNTDTSYLRMLLVWGYGPLQVSDMRIGSTDINTLEELDQSTISGFQDLDEDYSYFNSIYPNDVEQLAVNVEMAATETTKTITSIVRATNVVTVTTSTEHTFIVGNSVTISAATGFNGTFTIASTPTLTTFTYAQTATNASGSTGTAFSIVSPFYEKVINELCTSVSVNLHFPRGLRRLQMDGDGAGNILEELFTADVQVRQLDNETLAPLEDWDPVETRFRQASATIDGAFFGGSSAYFLTTPNACYRWAFLSLDIFNKLIVRYGSYSETSTANPSGAFLDRLKRTTRNLNTTYELYPTIPSNEIELYRICMYGAQVFSTEDKRSLISGTYTGLNLTVRTADVPVSYGVGFSATTSVKQTTASISAGSLSRTGRSTTIYIGVNGTEFVKRKDAFSYNVSFRVPEGKYEVRIRRNTTTTEEYTANGIKYQRMSNSILTSVTAYGASRPVNPPKPMAMTALRIKATDQINQTLEGVSATVVSICLDWDATNTEWVLRPTRNPASLFRYVLQHPANAQAVTDAQLDLTSIEEWHEYCAENEFIFDYVVTDQQSLLDVLRDICAAGRSSPTLVDGKWTVVTDKPRTVTAQYFTPHNSWGFESTKALPKLPHAFRVPFKNANQGYQPDEYIVYNDGYDATNATLFEQMEFPGVTSQDAIFKHARFHFAQIKLRPETYTLNADIENLICTRGDLVKVSHDVPMWGLGTGRIAEFISTTSIRLDEEMAMDANVTYTIRIRLEDGSSITRTVASKPSDGYYDTITLTSSITSTEGAVNNLFMFGELSSDSVDLIVQSIEPSNNLSALLTLVDYSPAIYNSDLEPIPEFNSQLSLPPLLMKDMITVEPLITSVISDETVMLRPAPNQFLYRIKLSFSNPATLPSIAKYLEGQIDFSGDTALIWQTSQSADIRDSSIYFTDVEEGSEYRIRVRYVTDDGRAGPWAYADNHTVAGKTNPPADVTGLTATVSGDKIKLEWNDNAELDLWGYEVRDTNSGWGTDDYIYRGSSSECLVAPGAIGVIADYFVKALDVIDLYSVNAASVIFTPSAIPAVSAINYTFADTSLTTTSLTLSWSDVAPQFGLSHYIISYDDVVVTARTSTLTVPVDWVGNRTFSVTVVDTQNKQSASTSVTVTKVIPNAPPSSATAIINNALQLSWAASVRTTLPIAGYELRSVNSSWGSAGFLFKGNALNFSVIPALGSNTWYVRSFDTDNRYSTTSLAINYTRAIPAPPGVHSPSYTFADTSLTNATVTLDWTDVSPLFGLDQYKIAYDTDVIYTKSSTITLPANWLGDKVFNVYTIDFLNGESDPLAITVTKLAPSPIDTSTIKTQIVDNNVLLYWQLPTKTSLPIQDILIKKGDVYETAEEIGYKNGTFTSILELTGGTYTYWLVVRDTDANLSSPVSITCQVSQPPDFVFNAQYFSTFSGTKSSAINDGGGLLLPVNTTETWTSHFTSRSWAGPSAQIAADYPIFIQPNNGTGSYVEVFDYGTLLGSSQITLNTKGEIIAGTPNISFDIGTSDDGITYTTITGVKSIFATSFRYVQVTVNVTTSSDKDLYLLSSLDALLSAKLLTDAGSVNAVSTDTDGTIVNFAKEFIDIASITVSPNGTTLLTPVYDFKDAIITGTYSVSSNVVTVNATAHGLLAGQKVRLTFTSGTAPNGVYTVASVVNANQYTVNLTTANTSGNISTYPESFRIYLFNSAGARTSGSVSWNVRGY